MGKSGMIEAGGKKLFLNVYAPTARLVIIGAVHISQALAPLARSLDYDVTVVDPRTAFASPERFPDVPLIAEWPDVALPPLNVDHYTAFVAVTHDPKIDDPALLHAFERDCFYIGALGSRKTHAKRGERLKAQGASDADIARIHAPIGLQYRRGLAVRNRRRRSWPRSPRSCGCRKRTPHEIRPRQSGGRDRRRHRSHPASGIAGAEEGHHDRRRRGRGAEPRRRQGNRRGRGLKTATSRRMWPRPASPRAIAGDGIDVERAFTGRANLFAAQAGVLVVDRDGGRPHQPRRRSHHLCDACRPSRRWSPAR